MAKILLIDSNPDHRKSLKGLFEYRMPHSVVIENDCVAGARACVAERPDLIMINLLLFLDHKFAFSRALSRINQTEKIPVLVHLSGVVEDLSRRNAEVNGAAGVLELPCTAEELGEEIHRAISTGGRRGTTAEVKTVTWPSEHLAEGQASAREVKPVDWVAMASTNSTQTQAPSADPGATLKERKTPDTTRKSTAGSSTFKLAAFDSVDPETVKSGRSDSKTRETFKPPDWPSVKPEDVKKSGGRSA
jgi:CheY-like chemotaxis protein